MEDAVDIDRRFHHAAAMIVMTMNDGVAFAAADPFFISPIRIKEGQTEEGEAKHVLRNLSGRGLTLVWSWCRNSPIRTRDRRFEECFFHQSVVHNALPSPCLEVFRERI